MGCVFCQNWETSVEGRGECVTEADLAAIMLGLQHAGCHNINLVSPTHYVPQILEAVAIAAGDGLSIPLVCNTGTSDSLEALGLLDGVVDIYLADAKYADERTALELSRVSGYFDAMKAALVEMQRQVGDLVCEDGIARRGLIVRHLVLPGGVAGNCELIRFIAEEVSGEAYVNIIDQYPRRQARVGRGAGAQSVPRPDTAPRYPAGVRSSRRVRVPERAASLFTLTPSPIPSRPRSVRDSGNQGRCSVRQPFESFRYIK